MQAGAARGHDGSNRCKQQLAAGAMPPGTRQKDSAAGHALRRLRLCDPRTRVGLLGSCGWLFLFFLLAGFGRSVAFEGRADAAFDNAIADADEFENCASASIAEARLSQPKNAGVTTGTIGESRCDLIEEDEDRLLVAQKLQAAATGSNGRRDS